MTKNPYIRIAGLSKSYQEGDLEHFVLREVALDVGQGEFTALLGASGSGKSTLLNLLSGIDEADAGQIWLDGRDLAALSETERTLFRRRHIGFIFQFFNLLPTLTARENVSLQLELDGVPPKAASARAQAMLEAVDLGARGDSYPDRLSGGEQQRVAIARALVHDPLLVLADEPTGNLDEDTGALVMDLLERLTREAGKNLLMATHSLENAGRADRILELHDGRLRSQA
jgi:putative ABC transport system ATP-binding protein